MAVDPSSRRLVARLPSSTHATVVYSVSLDAAGEYACTCPGFTYRKTCKHAATMAALRAQPVVERNDGDLTA